MTWIVGKMKWILLVGGVMTCSMFLAALAPETALRATFGETPSPLPPVFEIVVRNWGALIGLVGLMMVYGAFRPASRPLVAAVAAVSKTIFIGLVLTFGRQYLGKAGLAVGLDSLMVVLFALYLGSGRRE